MENRTILIVDDEPDFVQTLTARLAHEGYAVHSASDAVEARTKIQNHRPDLIVLDIMMPGIDGVQLFQLLRSRPRTAALPIIFVSVRSDILDNPAFGVDRRCRILRKPFDMEIFLRVVRESLAET